MFNFIGQVTLTVGTSDFFARTIKMLVLFVTGQSNKKPWLRAMKQHYRKNIFCFTDCSLLIFFYFFVSCQKKINFKFFGI